MALRRRSIQASHSREIPTSSKTRQQRRLPTVPGSLEQAIDALEADHKFLLEGGVFTQDVIDVWIEYKRAEIDAIRLRPHPWEFHLYFDM